MLSNIQALRAIAAYMVVFVHLPTVGGWANAEPLGAGVDIFFVISGFIMAFTTQGGGAPGDFLARRAARIAPLYWILTLVAFAVALTAPGAGARLGELAGELVRSLAFIPYARADGIVHPLLSVGWTLNYEMFFYLAFGLLLAVGSPLRRALALTALFAALVAAGLVLAPTGTAGRFYTDPIILEFVLGVWVHALYRAQPGLHPGHAIIRAAGLILAFRMADHLIAPRLPELWILRNRLVLDGVPAAILVYYAAVSEKARPLPLPAFVREQGDASYSIYLIHPLAIALFTKALWRVTTPGPATAILAMLVVLVLVGVGGVWAHRHVERPLTALARRRLAPAAPLKGSPA